MQDGFVKLEHGDELGNNLSIKVPRLAREIGQTSIETMSADGVVPGSRGCGRSCGSYRTRETTGLKSR